MRNKNADKNMLYKTIIINIYVIIIIVFLNILPHCDNYMIYVFHTVKEIILVLFNLLFEQ